MENITFDFNIPWRISQQGFIEVESLRLEWDRGLGARIFFLKERNVCHFYVYETNADRPDTYA